MYGNHYGGNGMDKKLKRKKGYQLFDVPNTSRGRRFVQDINDFINRDWYGYQRRGRSPKPGVPLNSQGQSRVLDSSGWAIYVRGVPVPKIFREHSAAKQLDYFRKELKYEYNRWQKTFKESEGFKKEAVNLGLAVKGMQKRTFTLFGWTISLWKDLEIQNLQEWGTYHDIS